MHASFLSRHTSHCLHHTLHLPLYTLHLTPHTPTHHWSYRPPHNHTSQLTCHSSHFQPHTTFAPRTSQHIPHSPHHNSLHTPYTSKVTPHSLHLTVTRAPSQRKVTRAALNVWRGENTKYFRQSSSFYPIPIVTSLIVPHAIYVILFRVIIISPVFVFSVHSLVLSFYNFTYLSFSCPYCNGINQ